MSGSVEGLRVLMVDDEPDTVDLVAFALGRAGAQVTCAATADDAWALFASAEPPFDVLVADYRMSEHDGEWLIRQVRQAGGVKGRVPAIAYTAEARHVVGASLLAAGYNAHLPKPVTTDDLVEKIAELLR
jgi:CheY-like chemotaxis protein